MSDQYSVTSAGVTPAEDRAYRMRTYFMVMGLRVACIVSLFWVRGWWVLLVGVGAVVLPYIAVLVANAVNHAGDGARPDAPTPLELTSPEPEGVPGSDGADTLIVIDAPAERRKSEGSA